MPNYKITCGRRTLNLKIKTPPEGENPEKFLTKNKDGQWLKCSPTSEYEAEQMVYSLSDSTQFLLDAKFDGDIAVACWEITRLCPFMIEAAKMDLAQYLKLKLQVLATSVIIRQAAAGLNFLHEHGIMHGDPKCENYVLYEKDGHHCIKIIDFGHSREIKGINLKELEKLLNPEDPKLFTFGHRPLIDDIKSHSGIDEDKERCQLADIWAFAVVCMRILAPLITYQMMEAREGVNLKSYQANTVSPVYPSIVALLSQNPKDRLTMFEAITKGELDATEEAEAVDHPAKKARI